MRSMHRQRRWLAATALAVSLTGAGSAGAFETHNFIEPPFGSFVESGGGSLAVDQATGDVYAYDAEPAPSAVDVFGPEGGAPVGGGPSSFTGAASPAGRFRAVTALAVDSACAQRGLSGSACTSFDPANGDVYISSANTESVDRYRLNGSDEYEYVSELVPEAEEGSQDGGQLAVDSAGNVYVGGRDGYSQSAIYEFDPTGKALRTFLLPGEYYSGSIAVSPSGTIYVTEYVEALQATVVVELKRSSLAGAVEGEPIPIPATAGVKGLAFDNTNGQLFVNLGSSGEALNGAREVVARFGGGVMSKSEALAVDEATGEVYAFNGTAQNIDHFGPGVVATVPVVDSPPPGLVDVMRTSALLSGTIGTGDATTSWRAQYVIAGEYRPADANPYAGGGATAPVKLAPSTEGTAIGPAPLTGLLAGMTYHYRLVASNEAGTTYGPDHTFATAAATPPVVVTGAASEVTQTGVLLSGTVVPEGLQTSYEFEVGTDTSYGGAKLFGNAGQSTGTEPVSTGIQFLIPGLTYHYRLVASNEDGTSYGQDMTFTTPGVPASIAQPATLALVPSPAVVFPSVAGAITRPQAGGKKKLKAKRKAKPHLKRRGRAKGKHHKPKEGGARQR